MMGLLTIYYRNLILRSLLSILAIDEVQDKKKGGR